MEWIKTTDRPLFIPTELGWQCTEDGEGEFIAAVCYEDLQQPNKTLWWIRHCVVEDRIGLCVVGDNDNEPAGWSLEDVSYWMPWVSPPNEKPIKPEPTNNNELASYHAAIPQQ